MSEPTKRPRRTPRSQRDRIASWTVAVFLLATGLPGIAPLVLPRAVVSSTEQRFLAKWPEWETSRARIAAWPGEVEAWYDDHLGFRDWLIRSWARLSIGVFGVSPAEKLVVGKSGWLFFGDRNAIAHYRGLDPLREPELDRWRRVLEERRDWLAARGITYLVVLVPDKHLVYPEFMPDSLPRVSEVHPLDQLAGHLAERSDVEVLDLRPALFAAKARERIYHKTDSHWNDRGAYAAYLAIHERLQRMLPALADVPPAEASPGRHEAPGMGLAHIVGLGDLHPEEVLEARLVAPRARIEPEHVRGYAERVERLQPIAHGVPDPSLPRAVVFRDSFANALVPYLAEDFSRVLFVWDRDVDPRVVAIEQPDVVIQEIVGRFLGRRPLGIEEVRERERRQRAR